MRTLIPCLAAMVAIGTGWDVQAGIRKRCAEPCTWQEVEKTVMVPTLATEKRVVRCVEYRPEIQERKRIVHELVPEVKEVVRDVCVAEPQIRVRPERYCVLKPVWKEETREVVVMVPHVEKRKGVRRVCTLVPVKEKRTVCIDEGCFEEQVCVRRWKHYKDCCGERICEPVYTTRKVWVPKLVSKEVEVVCMKPQYREEPFEYSVTVCKPERQKRVFRVCHYEREEKTVECRHTVYLPKRQTQVCKVTTYKCVPKEVTVKCRVLVPHTVTKEVDVTVCKLVPQKVMCRVPVAACTACGK